MINIMLMFALY